MPDIYVDVDTAVIVPVNIFPLTDDTDFKTIETAVVYNSAGMALTWNFVTSAGVVSQTAVTPTTAGVYDWSEPLADKGMYAIEIPASGGASINNDTEGYGWFTGVATGVLPWRSPIIGFRAASINNMLCDGTALETRLAELDAANLPTDVAAVKTDTAAILLDTGTDGVVVASGSKSGYALSAAGIDAILDDTVEGTLTLRQIQRIMLASLAGKSSGGGTTTIIFKGADGTTTRITATVDSDGNRTAITVDGAS